MGLKNCTGFQQKTFLGSKDNYESSRVVIVGAPFDNTASYRPGARFGPEKIRSVSTAIEEYSIYLDASLDDCLFYDAGNIEMPFGDIESCIRRIGNVAGNVINDGKIPLFIGGEHLVSVPAAREVYRKYGDSLVFIQLDAHADLRDEYLGNKLSHASSMRRILDFLPGRNMYQLGIRSGTGDEFRFARENTNLHKFQVISPLKDIVKNIADRPVYLSIDIDVADPAFAPGTGTPEPGGITSAELINAVCLFKDTNLVGADVVEVSPEYDISNRTALLAADIIREIVCICALKK